MNQIGRHLGIIRSKSDWKRTWRLSPMTSITTFSITRLHSSCQHDIPGYRSRGYGVMQSGENTNPKIELKHLKPSGSVLNEEEQTGSKFIWLVFPGMGCQSNSVDMKSLEKLRGFQESMHKSRETLKNMGMDLDRIIKDKHDVDDYRNVTRAIISTAAIQMALYDTLKSLDTGNLMKGYIGHSFGEVMAAYADGCLTAEETLLVSEARGRAVVDTFRNPGAMASVNLSWDTLKSLSIHPTHLHQIQIHPACHNGPFNVSVSALEENMTPFMTKLEGRGVLVRPIPTYCFAPHCSLMTEARDKLFEYLVPIFKSKNDNKDMIPTEKWISTSVPWGEWQSQIGNPVDPSTYFANNLDHPVLFKEAVELIPANSVVVELAPRAIFQTLLASSLGETSTVLNLLTKPGGKDQLPTFVEAVGQLFLAGVDLNFGAPVNVPVSAQTPFVADLVSWDHQRSWQVPIVQENELGFTSSCSGDEQDGLHFQGMSKPNPVLKLRRIISEITSIPMDQLESQDPNLQLKHFGADSLLGLELREILDQNFNLNFKVHQLLTLSLGQLLELEEPTNEEILNNSFEELAELEEQKVQMKRINSLLVPLNTFERDRERNGLEIGSPRTPRSPLFMVQGPNTAHSLLKPLASRIKTQVYGLQFHQNEERGYESIEKSAENLVIQIKMNQPRGPYYILGHGPEGGGVMAFEMAIQLENKYGDEVSNLIILDGGDFHWWKDVGEGESRDQGQGVMRRLVEAYQPKFKYSGHPFVFQASLFPSHKQRPMYHQRMKEICQNSVEVYTVDGDARTFLEWNKIDIAAQLVNDIWLQSVPREFVWGL